MGICGPVYTGVRSLSQMVWMLILRARDVNMLKSVSACDAILPFLFYNG
jgi:hypothetical protein